MPSVCAWPTCAWIMPPAKTLTSILKADRTGRSSDRALCPTSSKPHSLALTMATSVIVPRRCPLVKKPVQAAISCKIHELGHVLLCDGLKRFRGGGVIEMGLHKVVHHGDECLVLIVRTVHQ